MKRIFISVKPLFRVIFKDSLKKEVNNRLPLPGCNWEILYYCPDSNKWLYEKDKPKIILMRDELEVLPDILNPITDNDYLVRHLNVFKLNNKFSNIKKEATEHDRPVWVTVFDEICKGKNEDDIVNAIIDKLWPEKNAKLVDEFLTRVYMGETLEDICKDDIYKMFDFEPYIEEYEHFLKSQGENRNEAFIVLQEKMIKSIK
jgi:hypothetical protein